MRRLLLGLVVAVATLTPNLATGNDQAIARHIMSKLQLEQQRGSLKGFHVDMRVDRGTVWYKGFVSNQQQKNLILLTAQRAKNLGVVQVVDDISVRDTQAFTQHHPSVAMPNYAAAQALPHEAFTQTAPNRSLAQAVPNRSLPESGSQQVLAQMARQETLAQQAAFMQQDISVPRPAANVPYPARTPANIPATRGQVAPTNIASPQMTTPAMPTAMPRTAITQPMAQQPMPMARSASAPMPMAGDTASVPNYAWPTYAPHPNYAAVAYPRQYSPSAWPYIGPFYPYPQVPLGWRKVTLEWDDGWWWLDFHNR